MTVEAWKRHKVGLKEGRDSCTRKSISQRMRNEGLKGRARRERTYRQRRSENERAFTVL